MAIAGNTKNIIVGAAKIYLAVDNAGAADVAVQRADLPTLAAGVSANDALQASNAWRDLGFTTDGLEVAYEPDYGTVTVDQLKDAALLFSSALTVSVNTTLAEATLTNLMTAWGQDVTTLTTTSGATQEQQGVFTATAGTALNTTGGVDALNLNSSALGAYPVEHSLAAVGNAPRTTGGKRRERVYFARRVVSVSASTQGLRRTDATVFPVSFRMLPDPTYSGSEYGRVIDRTL